jgi:hypothetical protein
MQWYGGAYFPALGWAMVAPWRSLCLYKGSITES